MQKEKLVAILLLSLAQNNSAFAQAIFEGGGLNASAAGLGAGVAASAQHGKVVARTYESALAAQQAALAQTKAMQQYLKVGIDYEQKKDWDKAEKCFKYVLQVSAMRDGPGSDKTVPALKQLVNVAKAQNNLDEAIGYQKRVLGFAQAAKAPANVVAAQLDLSNLYSSKGEDSEAEPLLQQSYEMCHTPNAVPAEKRKVVMTAYAKVLKKLNKTPQAEKVENELAEQEKSEMPAASASGENAQNPKDTKDANNSEPKTPTKEANKTNP